VTNIATAVGDDPAGGEQSDDDTNTVDVQALVYGGEVLPTGTTCHQYVTGSFTSYADYYGSDTIQYSTKTRGSSEVINQVNPGAFFYYTGANQVLNAANAVNDGDDDDDKLTFTIAQENDNDGFPLFDILQGERNVMVYRVVDNGDGVIGEGDTCERLKKGVEITVTDEDGKAGVDTATISVGTDVIGDDWLIASVKYKPASVKGTDASDPYPEVHYDFATKLGGVEGEVVDAPTNGGLDLVQKFDALKVDASSAPLSAEQSGGEGLSEALLAEAIDAAIDYWASQGVNVRDLAELAKVDVRVEDLGGDLLAKTAGLSVVLDDDAAGYGWSDSVDDVDLDDIDLLSVLTHEFGHVLGYDHEIMGESLEVGVRDLPMEDADILVDDRMWWGFSESFNDFYESMLVG